MFIRILRGQAYDGAATLAEIARWRQELGGATPGWQRFTAGVTDDGEAVAVLRFANEAAAMNGGGRPEHADGIGFTEVTYFTSEREARAGERQMPVEMAVQLGTVRSYMEGLEFHELRDPMVVGPPVPVP